MERLIYQAKGAPKIAVIMLLCGGIGMPIAGIMFIILSQMKRSTSAVYTSVSGTMTYAGSIGGGYMVNQEARTTMIIIGIVAIVLGIAVLSSIPATSKTNIKVFENHIEGCVYPPIIIGVLRRDYFFRYTEISGIQNVKNVLIIHHVSGTVKRIALKDEKTVMEVMGAIQQCQA